MSGANGSSGVKVAAAPCSWGVFEKTEDDPLQLPPEAMLDQMAAAGYAGTELGPPGYFGDAEQLRSRLGSRGLSLVGAFLPQRFSRVEHAAEDREWMIGVLDLLAAGRPDDVMPKAVLADASLEPERMRWAGQIPGHPEAALPKERFSVLIDNLHRAGEAARERGFDPVLHFHAGSYVESAAEIHAVFDALDTSLVGMCLDTGHALFGGADPLELLDTYAGCVRHVHVKDCDLSRAAGGRQLGGRAHGGLGPRRLLPAGPRHDRPGRLRGCAQGARLGGLGRHRAGPLPEAGGHAGGAAGPAHGQSPLARGAGLLRPAGRLPRR